MTDIVWPSSLPAPTVEGYAINPGEGVLRTQMDSGLARQRRVFTQTPTTFNVRWILTNDQYQTFEGWYQYFADEGASEFIIDLSSGQGISAHTARFLGQFSASLIAQNLWQVSAQLETINRPVVSQGYLKIAMNNNIQELYSDITRYGAILENMDEHYDYG